MSFDVYTSQDPEWRSKDVGSAIPPSIPTSAAQPVCLSVYLCPEQAVEMTN